MAITQTGGVLSGSSNGKPIKITGTTSGTAVTLHTAGSAMGDGNFDEPWLYCYNSDSSDRTLTVGFGGTGADQQQTYTIPAGQKIAIYAGIERLNNSLVISAWASAANVLFVTGGYNRVTTT